MIGNSLSMEDICEKMKGVDVEGLDDSDDEMIVEYEVVVLDGCY